MTNLFTNPIAAVNTTGASNASTGTTISRSTTVGYEADGTSFLLSFPGLGTERARFRVSGLSLTGAVRRYVSRFKAIGPAGNELRIWTRIGYSDASSVDSATPTFALTGDWDSVIVPVVAADPAKTIASIDLFVERVTASAWDVNVSRIEIVEDRNAALARIRSQFELRPY